MIKTASLQDSILSVVKDKGTEAPFSGAYNHFSEPGSYLCRQCGLALFRTATQFHSSCGWPSFDEEIHDVIAYRADGDRTEIICARCHAHLGHVFEGEGFTAKNKRHCVNSLSLEFVSSIEVKDTEEAILAGGCFWGVQHHFKSLSGVLNTEVGYTGGKLKNPSYEAVCSGESGHYEAVRVVYDVNKLNFAAILEFFFKIHNPTQADGQGPDRGQQYMSVIFYYDELQKEVATKVIRQFQNQGYRIATKLLAVSTFYPAEQYHQDYYAHHPHLGCAVIRPWHT